MLTPIFFNNNQPSFGVNYKSPKLRLSQKDFFIRIPGYGQNKAWVNIIKKTTDEAVKNIRDGWDSDWVLFSIAQGVKYANKIPLDLALRSHTGVLRCKKAGWECESDWTGCVITTPYDAYKYKTYEKRLDALDGNPLKKPFEDIALAFPSSVTKEIYHPAPDFIENALKHIEKRFRFLQDKFVKNEVQEQDLKIVNDNIAEIRWIMAHSMPWERGSDSISNVFMRAIYKAMGVKAYPPAKGISFDLEAFCTNLDDYKEKFTSFFEKPPVVVE